LELNLKCDRINYYITSYTVKKRTLWTNIKKSCYHHISALCNYVIPIYCTYVGST